MKCTREIDKYHDCSTHRYFAGFLRVSSNPYIIGPALTTLQNMKPFFTLLISAAILIGCNSKELTPEELVTEYYSAFQASDFDRISAVIADSITITEGDYIVPYTKESFYQQFKWDSIFQSTYEVVQLENHNDQIIATIASSSIRYKFLKNDPLICRFRISFGTHAITKLESLDCLGANWKVWQAERDSLVNWTKAHHPELDGFIHDLSMKGAIDYLKAIELYEGRK